jgi:hypothetical protein
MGLITHLHLPVFMDAVTEPKSLNFLFTTRAVRLLNATIGELKKNNNQDKLFCCITRRKQKAKNS